MPTLAYFYKLGFLTACADRGLDPAQAEALAEQQLSKRAGLIDGAFRLAGNTGAAAGLGLGHLIYGSGRPDALKPNTAESEDEKLRRLMAMTQELKRRRTQLTQTPGLFA